MAHARRAAPEAPEVWEFAPAPRRSRVARVAGARRGIAPTAVVGLLVATTALTFLPVGANDSTSVADPLAAHSERVANRASREFTRGPVESGLAEALSSPSTVPTPAPVPSEISPATPVPVPSVAASTPEVVAPVETTPAVDWSVKGADAGSGWSTASVNVRTGPGTGFDVISAIIGGHEVTLTDLSHDGWHQISWEGGAGWVKANFLSEKEPVAPTKESSSTGSTASQAAPKDDAPAAAGTCAKAGNATNGMTSRTVSVLQKVCARFPSITSYGGYRAGSSGYHGSGQAIDAMISGQAGWDVARWVRANASSLGVVEVIYSQKIWTSQRSGDGWRSMSSRGSASADHYDHVHISVA